MSVQVPFGENVTIFSRYMCIRIFIQFLHNILKRHFSLHMYVNVIDKQKIVRSINRNTTVISVCKILMLHERRN